MVENSKIAWTDHTFNAWEGCAKVSPACAHCYAETMADKRYGRVKWGVGQSRRRTSEENWRKPIRWNKQAQALGVRYKVFSLSLGDWLDDEVPIEWLSDLLGLISQTPNLDWLLLSKRVEGWSDRLLQVVKSSEPGTPAWTFTERWLNGFAPANVWVGATIEDQKRADERIPILSDIPAVIRFLSCEPLLESVSLLPFAFTYEADEGTCGFEVDQPFDWIIIGGESGEGARPFCLTWAKNLLSECQTIGISPFVKQLGRLPIDVDGNPLKLVDKAGADINEFPDYLKIRQFPNLATL